MKIFNWVCLIAVVMLLLACEPAVVEPKVNPWCRYQEINEEKFGGQNFHSPAVIESTDGVLRTSLTVQYADNMIAGCPVRLREYDGHLVGPTLRVKPGDRLEIDLYNLLPENTNPPPDDPWFAHNGGYDFNITNFHSHGLWVDPNGKSDNVLRRMKPNKKPYEVRIQVPKEHPAGTFWYHAHLHGSTAVQVSSGMAGTLIVEGGLDDVPAIAKAREHIFVFQQIYYDESGVIEDFKLFGQHSWQDRKRHTLINGQLVPTIYMRPGEVQRWRFVHAGIHEALHLQLQGHALHEIALDGLSLGRVNTWNPEQLVELYPGYRVDVMVKAKTPAEGESNTFLLLDAASTDQNTPLLSGVQEDQVTLAKIVIRGDPVDMALPTDKDVATTKAHENLELSEVTEGQEQSVEFCITKVYCDPAEKAAGSECKPCDGVSKSAERYLDQCGDDAPSKFMVNNRPFSESYQFTAKVGTVGKWTVRGDGHPFHIHVNPFQITRKGPDGNDENVWKDTLFVDKEYVLLTRYERFTGKFVMHCHILDHEDRGMMSLVEIKE